MLWPQKHVLALLGSRQNAMPLNDLNVSAAAHIVAVAVAFVALVTTVVRVAASAVVVVVVAVAWLCCAI